MDRPPSPLQSCEVSEANRKAESERMTIREIAWLALMAVTGILNAVITVYGAYLWISIDFDSSPVLSYLFGTLPLLCFPTFLLVRRPAKSAAITAILALAYLIVYSALNWRTCSELGYCTSVVSTVVETLKTWSVMAFVAVPILTFAAQYVDRPQSGKPSGK